MKTFLPRFMSGRGGTSPRTRFEEVRRESTAPLRAKAMSCPSCGGSRRVEARERLVRKIARGDFLVEERARERELDLHAEGRGGECGKLVPLLGELDLLEDRAAFAADVLDAVEPPGDELGGAQRPSGVEVPGSSGHEGRACARAERVGSEGSWNGDPDTAEPSGKKDARERAPRRLSRRPFEAEDGRGYRRRRARLNRESD